MENKAEILDFYKKRSVSEIIKLNSSSAQHTELILGIGRVLFEASGFVPAFGSIKTSYDIYQRGKHEVRQYGSRFLKEYLPYCNGQNIKTPYRTDFFSLSEQDQALVLKRQFDHSQEQKQIAYELKKLNSNSLCCVAAEYEESRESITSSLVYAILLDKFKDNIEDADLNFEKFMVIKNHLRSLKYQPHSQNENDDGAANSFYDQENSKTNEDFEKQQFQQPQQLTSIEALNEHKIASISNEILLNALKVLETSPESENTKAFFNHITETVLRTYEKSMLEVYYASIAQIANVEQTELVRYICEDAERTKELFETLANNEAFLRYKKNLKSGQEFESVLKEFLEIHNKLNELMKEQKIQYTVQPEFKELLSHFKQFNEQQLAEISMLLDQNQRGLSYIKSLVEYDLASSVSDFDELKNTLISLNSGTKIEDAQRL